VDRRPRTRALELDGTHVLIVDDEADARELLRVMLASTGARISEAETAAEALRIYSEDRPDILIADVAMPDQNGYALLRAIRGLAAGEGGHVRAIASDLRVAKTASARSRPASTIMSARRTARRPTTRSSAYGCTALRRCSTNPHARRKCINLSHGMALFKVFVEYAGTNTVAGKPENARTVQRTDAGYREVTAQKQFERWPGRTDAGVHALEQVAHSTSPPFQPRRCAAGLTTRCRATSIS
jgi:CheY-like chemotaxis protein